MSFVYGHNSDFHSIFTLQATGCNLPIRAPILVFLVIQPFGSDVSSCLGKGVLTTGHCICELSENSSVSFVMKYCPTSTTVRNPASRTKFTQVCLPEVPEEEVPVVESFDGLARVTSKELLAPIHSVKSGTLQNACSTRPRLVADLGKKCSYAHRQEPSKRFKKNDDKSAMFSTVVQVVSSDRSEPNTTIVSVDGVSANDTSFAGSLDVRSYFTTCVGGRCKSCWRAGRPIDAFALSTVWTTPRTWRPLTEVSIRRTF